jgi:hypothetical protein
VSGVALAAGSSSVPLFTLWTTPISRIFGYKTGQGYPIDNAGWCDFIVNITVASSTAVAGNLLFKVDYLV